MAERLQFTAREVSMALTVGCAAYSALVAWFVTAISSQPQMAGRPTWLAMALLAWGQGAALALGLGVVVAAMVHFAGLRWPGLRGRWAALCGVTMAGFVALAVTVGAVQLYVERPLPWSAFD